MALMIVSSFCALALENIESRTGEEDDGEGVLTCSMVWFETPTARTLLFGSFNIAKSFLQLDML